MRRRITVAVLLGGIALGAGALSLGQAQPEGTSAPPAHRSAQTMPRPREPIAQENCTTSGCHSDVKDHRVVHGPVSVDACNACHTLENAEQHTFSLTRSGGDLCTFCHDVDVAGAAVVHQPIMTGDCTSCHNPHGGPDRSFLNATSARDLCQQCHVDVIGNNLHAHGPVAAGACSVCHAPHASPHPNLLKAEGPQLCVTCHVTTETQLSTLRHVHQPAGDDCQACHDAHASNHPMMLHREPQALCLECHESIRHMVTTASTQHAAVTTDRACLNCHDAHASDFPSILQGDMMDLCFECHDREIKMEDGKTLGNIKAVIETGHSLHGPVAQHNCAACHQIHGGDNFRLLIKEYPPEFYAPFEEESYALCFSCHDKRLVENPRTTTLTDFRNGDLNLHYLHVNRDTKGRTCRACHETHASNKANHIRESVPFGSGGWELPIRFEEMISGGSCAPGCHVPYEYNRDDPVTYPELPGQALWPAEDQGRQAPDQPQSPPATEGDGP